MRSSIKNTSFSEALDKMTTQVWTKARRSGLKVSKIPSSLFLPLEQRDSVKPSKSETTGQDLMNFFSFRRKQRI